MVPAVSGRSLNFYVCRIRARNTERFLIAPITTGTQKQHAGNFFQTLKQLLKFG
jgi:hypothetical protein